jgi:hypothetical protein
VRFLSKLTWPPHSQLRNYLLSLLAFVTLPGVLASTNHHQDASTGACSRAAPLQFGSGCTFGRRNRTLLREAFLRPPAAPYYLSVRVCWRGDGPWNGSSAAVILCAAAMMRVAMVLHCAASTTNLYHWSGSNCLCKLCFGHDGSAGGTSIRLEDSPTFQQAICTS